MYAHELIISDNKADLNVALAFNSRLQQPLTLNLQHPLTPHFQHPFTLL